MSVRISINVQGVRRYLEAEKQFWEQTGNEAMNYFSTKGVEILQKNVPKGRTMQLHDRCKAEVAGKSVRIFSDAPHAKHVDGEGKTAPSPGRFVPQIGRKGKKLVRPSKYNPKIGVHPGSKKTPFGRMAAEELRAEGEEWIRQKVRERR